MKLVMGMTTVPAQFCDIPLEHRSVDVDENDFVEGFRNYKTFQRSKLYVSLRSAKLNFDQMLEPRLQAKYRENANASVYVQKEQVNFTHCNDHMFIQIPN